MLELLLTKLLYVSTAEPADVTTASQKALQSHLACRNRLVEDATAGSAFRGTIQARPPHPAPLRRGGAQQQPDAVRPRGRAGRPLRSRAGRPLCDQSGVRCAI